MTKIRNPGWYLLSTISGGNINDLKNSYGILSYLDVSVAYVPLYADISSASNISLTDDETTVIAPSDLCFNYTLGKVIEGVSFEKHFLGKIDNFSDNFTDNFGIWVYIYNPPTKPILDISLNNSNKQYDNTNNSTRPIKQLIINGNIIDISKSTIDLSFHQHSDVSMTFERCFDFSFEDIFSNFNVRNNDYINFNTSDNSNTLLFSSNFSGTDLDRVLDTSNLIEEADISFTIFNSNPLYNNQKLVVNFNIDVSDTIFPSIDFYNPTQLQTAYNFTSTNIYTGQNNKVDVSLNQTIIYQDVSINATPLADFYDQNKITEVVFDSSITPLTSSIINPVTLSMESIQYAPFPAAQYCRAGIYNFKYGCIDSVGKTTIVDLSLEIIDDFRPTITIKPSINNIINAYSTAPTININDYDNTDIPYQSSDISGVGFTLSDVFTGTSNDLNIDSSRNIYFKFTELSGNDWYFPDVSSVIDWPDVDISTNPVSTDNSAQSWPSNDLSNNFFYTDPDISFALRQTSFNNNNPNIQRTYQVSDNNYTLTNNSRPDNTTTLTTNYFIWDDTIPIVDVSFKHTIFKIDTSNSVYNASDNLNNVYGDLTSILQSNAIQTNQIVINLYDDIEFKFSMNKECKCKVDLSSHIITPSSHIIEPTSSNYESTHTINLTHTDTYLVGIHHLIFTIWDRNNNFYKFKYDISINDIPAYTLKIIQDLNQSDLNARQKLLLRVANPGQGNNFQAYFAQLEIQSNQSSWVPSFSSAAKVYNNNAYGLIGYQKVFDGYYGLFQYTIPSSGAVSTQAFTTSLNNGIYYEILYFPDSPILEITNINKFRIDSQSRGASVALGANNFTEVKDSVGFYNGNSSTLYFNSSS